MNHFGEPVDPHGDQRVLTAGEPMEDAGAVMVLVHGRGASAESMLALYAELHVAGLHAIAPEAQDRTWYPQSFLAPSQMNQPYLDSALQRIATIVTGVIERGVPSSRIALIGFSQGACLTSEFVARHSRRYGAVMALTGGLIGPPGTPREYSGSLSGTPVFLGAGDPDPHVPYARVEETAAVLRAMGADVDLRRYPGMPHTVNAEEITACRELLQRMVDAPEEST